MSLQVAHAQLCHEKNPFQDFKAVSEKAACEELKVGNSKLVSFYLRNSPTGIPHAYELQRIAPDKYKVRLNLRLIENTGMLGEENTETTKAMRTKIQQCVKWMNSRMIGPSGQKLEVEVIDRSSENVDKYKEIEVPIRVDKKAGIRENAGHYTLETDCPTVAHEFLHLMGLVDEYPETEYLKDSEIECRSYGPPASIMSNHIEAAKEDQEDSQEFIVSCCVCKNDQCKANTIQGPLNRCPVGYSNIKASFKKKNTNLNEVSQEAGRTCEWIGGLNVGIGFGVRAAGKEKNTFPLSTTISPRPHKSLIYPAHFRAIIAPGCKEKNQLYYECARDSYYRPYRAIGNCHQKPRECFGSEEWLK